ncbi:MULTISPECIES: hypothetical protein [Halobacterium]|uniref:hypothetical protein n=1 Tax=Halobacterium TaxID=2239 RepID=UPI000A6EEE10|nr:MULTISPECIES: hypothetical protein [Halobacterium]MCG1001895.1 hypothetical protein [Halobacterium noricense]
MDNPERIELTPNHIGAIGEALFDAMYAPPEPATQLIREMCRSIAPDWVTIDDLTIQSRSDDYTYRIESEDSIQGEESVRRKKPLHQWERDGVITARYRPSGEEREQLKEELGKLDPSWRYEFPVEIKTGTGAELKRDQLNVMELLAENSDTQPILIRLGLEPLPDAFSVEEVRLVGNTPN